MDDVARRANGIGRCLAGCLLGQFLFVPCRADLASFCTSAPPTGAGTAELQALYKAQCPAYLQGQFSSAAAGNVSSPVTTQLAQEQSQASINSSIAGLVKPPASQIASGSDISSIAMAAQLKDAQITFNIAKEIGIEIAKQLDQNAQVFLVASASDRASLLSAPVDAATVLENIRGYTAIAGGIHCPVVPGRPQPAFAPAVAILGAEALASIAATATSMFQSQLLATGKASGVSDPSQLIVAGLVAGLGEKRKFLHLYPPAITTLNKVLGALQELRVSLGKANMELAKCTSAANYAADTQKVKDANAYVTSLVTATGTNPSLLDLAARRSAMDEAHVKFTLLLQRDVSGGGASAIKPNWFSSVKLTMATADLITYELVDFDGTVSIADYKWDHWSQTTGLDTWSNTFTDYRKP